MLGSLGNLVRPIRDCRPWGSLQSQVSRSLKGCSEQPHFHSEGVRTMKRRMLALAGLAVAMWATLPQEASAFGKRSGASSCNTGCGYSGGCGGYSGYYGGCGGYGMVGGGCGPQYTVSWVDQKVTAYKTETETKE